MSRQTVPNPPITKATLKDLFMAMIMAGTVVHEVNKPLDFGSIAEASEKAAQSLLEVRARRRKK